MKYLGFRIFFSKCEQTLQGKLHLFCSVIQISLQISKRVLQEKKARQIF